MKRLLILTTGFLLALTSARAAEPIQVTIVGKSTGEIAGSAKDGSIEGLAMEHEIVTPRDASSGLPTGRRQHKPLTIVKPIDKASPLLMKLLANNESATVTLRFTRPDPNGGGKPQQYYTIKLTNAAVGSIREWKPNTRDVSADRAGDLEEISFIYQKIEWTWTEGGVTFEDSWSSSAT
jgi:type VI secretion system secreted protein Hcp